MVVFERFMRLVCMLNIDWNAFNARRDSEAFVKDGEEFFLLYDAYV